MWKYIVKRILMLIPVMLATIFVVYFIMDQSDVDPAKVMLGEGATEESIQELCKICRKTFKGRYGRIIYL